MEHKPGDDPVIQFYEPFLNEYDPKEREARGVYYTPKPVVDYIVRSVDYILRSKFGKLKGLADETVHLLDPAAGTGTFLMSAIQTIYSNIKKENTSLGAEMVNLEFNKVVVNHILKHFYGFELLIAPYAVAHLKLTLEVERMGFNFLNTKLDDDKDNDRFKIYLANTLDDPNKPPAKLFGFDSIPQESEKAREVKKNVPILAIIGNPPYSISSQNQGEWISNLVADYKRNLNEQNINALSDDYVKFIRFASWKLSEVGQGVFAMITSNTFIDGLVHRQMRRSLMDTFDEIYIYNLHGSLRRGETMPDGGRDENVFDIQSGVSINIFVKHTTRKEESIVKYQDLWGLREDKFTTLMNENFEEAEWQKIVPKEPNWFFVHRDTSSDKEYESYRSLKDIFPVNGSGIKFRKDNLLVKGNYEREDVVKMISDLKNLDEGHLKVKYDLVETNDWKIKDKKIYFVDWQQSDIQKVQYRPFDARWTYYPLDKIAKIITRGDSRASLMKNFIKPNIGLIATRQFSSHKHFVLFTTDKLTEISSQPFAPNNVFPLYLYNETTQSTLLDQDNRRPNISQSFIKEFCGKLGLKFIFKGKGDLKSTFGPESIFYYAYAIFHSPTYRSRYVEQLKIDFPRLPLVGDKKLLAKLVLLGNELVNLHLLGENPFDKSKTIIDEPERWGIKIGGEKPANLPDWQVVDVLYNEKDQRVNVNKGQYFEGVEKEVWEFMVGGYQVCEKWLKDRKKAERALSADDLKHYMKIVVSIRETLRVMKEIDQVIPSWPLK